MKRGIKGEMINRVMIMIMMMVMVMGCNSGGVKDAEKVFLSEMVNLGKGFMEVFVSFGDMITGTLGIKAETKKSEIGAYFTKIENTMKRVKEKLGKILEKNGNYPKVKEKVEEFIGKISKIEEGAKDAASGATGGDAVGNAVKNESAIAASKEAINVLVKGIKVIVGVVLKDNEGNPGFTKTGGEQQKTIGGLFEKQDNAGETVAAAASASIGAVSGADILKAILKSKENPDIDDTDGIVKAKDASGIAVAPFKDGKKDISEATAKKDAVIAAGIALRGMAKEGKFAAKNEDQSENAVNGAVASAVNKVLSTLVIAIRDTVDEGLKGISEVLGEIKQGEGSEAKVKAN
ncbi:Variable outer membrane protein (plasmid) [Borrelia crocidurae DOU]|uniref:Variable large protein n=1 Tax=Borrelia crocidurae DOU TaxID=1293575 RepID=W5SK84_9SPIR|nr:variable large family protein [Borrelia crocidurae]AHH07295.1 Variable outer membrane protein [Borrelia crocidurae DOU]